MEAATDQGTSIYSEGNRQNTDRYYSKDRGQKWTDWKAAETRFKDAAGKGERWQTNMKKALLVEEGIVGRAKAFESMMGKWKDDEDKAAADADLADQDKAVADAKAAQLALEGERQSRGQSKKRGFLGVRSASKSQKRSLLG